MRKLLIKGGPPLHGSVKISGAKNSALPIMAASLLLNGESHLTNIPLLNDVVTMIRVLRVLGLRVEYSEPNTVHVWVNGKIKHVAPYELVTKMRASFFIIGPILARMGLAKVPLPGGCAIGFRPVNYYIKGLEALGASIEMEHGFVIAKAKKLKGAKIYLDFPSVGATESLMMAATLAEGKTVIENAAQEPEIGDLAIYLKRCGALIEGEGTETITITGVEKLKGCEHKIIPDRIEAGTFLLLGSTPNSRVTVENVIPDHLIAVTTKLSDCGASIKTEGGKMIVSGPKKIKAVNFKTLPYPGFPTDMQSQFTSLLSVADGTSVINETIFENRFMHVQELKRMGADIQIEGHSVIINGVDKLSGAPVRASDLRAGAALTIAGLIADGETLIDDIDRHIDRGYEKFAQKLKGLGADVQEIA
ncbi:MAG: UDP-N-acetylglucosamine 1-carboxyvinyltransferase [Candidatus Saganbacteria bacterium]|nr:UDP-N-acetylglucosamine 1-carboxyvinyltransferase [Candidatus Saganbacteria bacterium]